MKEREKGIMDDTSRESKNRTNNATSQGDLPKRRLQEEDMPQADQERFKDGVYTGTGTGAGPGGSTDTGGADTSTMEGNARLGTTDRTQANENDK